MLTEKDVLIAACGKDRDGYSKSAVKIDDAMIDATTGEEDVNNELLLDNAVVNIFRNSQMTMVDLTFDNPEDYEFTQLVYFLQEATAIENTMDTYEQHVPSVIITICPKALEFEYYVTGIHAMWCVQPSQVGGANDTVRLIFTNNMFHVYHMDIDKLLEDDQETEE